jgi:hypothetical protein
MAWAVSASEDRGKIQTGLSLANTPFAPPGRRTRSRSAWCSTIGAQRASTEATKRTADLSGYKQIWQHLRTRRSTDTYQATGTRLGSQQRILPHHQALTTAPCSHEQWVCETPVPQRARRARARQGGRHPAHLLGRRGALGDANNCGQCLHTSESKQGPQRSAKTGLQQGDATPSNKNQDPALKSYVAESKRLAKVGNTLQTYIFNRVDSPQSSYEDFPLATGLMFDTDK